MWNTQKLHQERGLSHSHTPAPPDAHACVSDSWKAPAYPCGLTDMLVRHPPPLLTSTPPHNDKLYANSCLLPLSLHPFLCLFFSLSLTDSLVLSIQLSLDFPSSLPPSLTPSLPPVPSMYTHPPTITCAVYLAAYGRLVCGQDDGLIAVLSATQAATVLMLQTRKFSRGTCANGRVHIYMYMCVYIF